MKDRMKETTAAINSLKDAITAIEWAARDDLGMDLLAACIHELQLHDNRLGAVLKPVERRAERNAMASSADMAFGQ